MKKFSTAVIFLALAGAAAHAPAANTSPAEEPRCSFLPDAPDQYTVVQGDTLWGISGQFLQHAWCWPQVWGMNQEQIRNPHWIYPGQTVYLDRVAGRLQLTQTGNNPGRQASLPTVRLSPKIRSEKVGNDSAVPSIPPGAIEPFLSEPLVVEEEKLAHVPRVVSTGDGRVNLGKDDLAYVLGDLKGETTFQVFRPGTPLRDPESREIIGHEAAYLGTLKLERHAKADNEAHAFRVVNVKQEIGVGDRLLPIPPAPIIQYVPHPPGTPVDARVVSVYGGVRQAGQNQIVAINRGKRHGIDVGTVLELSRAGQTVVDRTQDKKLVKLPDLEYGNLFVFRVFDNISYALIMQVTQSVQIGDTARNPE